MSLLVNGKLSLNSFRAYRRRSTDWVLTNDLNTDMNVAKRKTGVRSTNCVLEFYSQIRSPGPFSIPVGLPD